MARGAAAGAGQRRRRQRRRRGADGQGEVAGGGVAQAERGAGRAVGDRGQGALADDHRVHELDRDVVGVGLVVAEGVQHAPARNRRAIAAAAATRSGADADRSIPGRSRRCASAVVSTAAAVIPAPRG